MLSEEVAMVDKKSSIDLTTTIHLGDLRSTQKGASQEDFLSGLSGEEQEIVAHLASGDGMLIIHRGPGKGSRYLLNESTTVGREMGSHIFLDDVTISRKHALLVSQSKSFSLEDLGSLNGTYVNGESITKISLKNGDEIQIGKFHMLFFGGNK
jgi:pSer/pThr/pTyr-binding forkhead associated (FHA) protein